MKFHVLSVNFQVLTVPQTWLCSSILNPFRENSSRTWKAHCLWLYLLQLSMPPTTVSVAVDGQTDRRRCEEEARFVHETFGRKTSRDWQICI